jgi:N-6 DNA Methylase
MSTVLETLHFTPTGSLPGLVSVDGELPERIEEQYAIRQARDIGEINYVFFRRFADGRSSQSAACVIDNSDDHLDEAQLAKLHSRLWLNGFSPLLYVAWQTRVDVLSCARGPDFWKSSRIEYGPAERIEIAKQISFALDDGKLSRFSAFRLSDGTFWDDPANSRLAQSEKAAHQQLIRAVVETDDEIDGHSQPVLRRLLLLTILIKYLEDRGVFPKDWFKQFQPGATSFFDLLRQGSPDTIRELLAKLERKFNGDVFELSETGQRLTVKALRRFADLVEGKTLGSQRYLWEQYSFRHIPVEVLSHLYQHFAQEGKGAVFTPPMVATLMLDYVMPYKSLTGQERVLDPTCGSGIFLVGAFRRLVHFWQSKNNWEQPEVATLKRILKQSIFGVELQEEAVHLTAFSLALAICDALQPNVIWRELRFDKLVGANLQIGDFSEWLKFRQENAKDDRFSVVVGNPPFMSKLNDAAVRFRRQQKRSAAIPDNQMAYFILEQATSLLADGGRLCLIQPHGFLYNEKARAFQQSFLSSASTEAILDFTSIRQLYDGADPKTVAVLCTGRKPRDNHHIQHLTFRRTFSVKERIAFELDHYDRHLVVQGSTEKQPWIWRANLLGGGRLQNLAARMDELPKLRDFFKRMQWDYGEGFVLAETGNRQPAPWLTGKPFLPTDAFDESGIDLSKISTVTAKRFRSSYSETRYSAPLILIKEVETLPCVFWNNGFLAYRHQIVGIHAPRTEERRLRQFHTDFIENRRTLRAICAVLGTRALSSKATSILKRDIDVLPWPEKESERRLSWWEKRLCDDVVEYATDFVRLGQNSRLFKEQVTTDYLKVFSDVFVRVLGSVYANLQPIDSGLLDGLAYQAFCFGPISNLDWPADWGGQLREIVFRDHGDALRTVRILRFYERNTIILVKPDRLRYWISSTAIRDADETLVDLQRQGY